MKCETINIFLFFLLLATRVMADDAEIAQASVLRQNALLREIGDIFDYRNPNCESFEIFAENIKNRYKGKSVLQFPFGEILMVANADSVSIERSTGSFDLYFKNSYNYSYFTSVSFFIMTVSFSEANEIDWIRISMSSR